MRLRKGQMWDHPADLILVTTNSFVRKDGRLFMGRGAARDAAKYWPECQYTFRQLIEGQGSIHGFYGVIVSPHDYQPPWRSFNATLLNEMSDQMPMRFRMTRAPIRLGAFQVKVHWEQDAEVGLIEKSVGKLNEVLALKNYKKWSVSMNFPGIGNGRLQRDQVLPLIEPLPDNVTIWEK